jgi:hypothetical protein
MNGTGFKWAILNLVITSSSSLITLFSQSSIQNFSDIAPVSYAVAILGGVLAAAQTYAARVKDSPV